MKAHKLHVPAEQANRSKEEIIFGFSSIFPLTLLIFSVASASAMVAFTMVCWTFASRKSCDLTGGLSLPHTCSSCFMRGTFNFS